MSARQTSKPSLYGLVLAGGKSRRLGHDKGLIEWLGKPQRYYLADLLARHCVCAYISCRPDQVGQIEEYEAISDIYPDLGSYGALLSAMSHYPDKSWLVVACDMPFVDDDAIDNLIKQRDAQKLATAYFNPENGLPEPMLAIWEPTAFDRLVRLSKAGLDCPRKALIKFGDEANLVRPHRAETIININTPADKAAAEEALASK